MLLCTVHSLPPSELVQEELPKLSKAESKKKCVQLIYWCLLSSPRLQRFIESNLHWDRKQISLGTSEVYNVGVSLRGVQCTCSRVWYMSKLWVMYVLILILMKVVECAVYVLMFRFLICLLFWWTVVYIIHLSAIAIWAGIVTCEIVLTVSYDTLYNRR